MSLALHNLIGLPLADFNHIASEGKEIKLRHARLIPMYKSGDEMALTSIFLSSLRLIKEFRREVSKSINMISSGQVHVYTEIVFPKHNNMRIDGLVLVVKGGKVRDAALLEMKNKSNELDNKQICEYLAIARDYRIPKLITVSNQFVSTSTQSPLHIRIPRGVSMYHLSWSYILTIARLLLYDNSMNISDPDQVEIMKEVVHYLEQPESGVCGFTSMKPGWKEVVQKMNTGAHLRVDDMEVTDAVTSWLQEERDMTLILSRRLGLLVRSGEKKYKTDLVARTKAEMKRLISDKCLESSLFVDGAVSIIRVRANLDRRNIVMSIVLEPPKDRKTKGQISWIKYQLKRCRDKNPNVYEDIEHELRVGIGIKYSSKQERVTIPELDTIPNLLIGREIKEFAIIQVKDLGRTFSSRRGFVQTIEAMLLDFYQGVVQHLKRWEKPAPKMPPRNADPDSDSDSN